MSEFNENYNEILDEETPKEAQKASFEELYQDFFTPEYWAQRDETIKIKKCGNAAGISFIVLLVLSFVISILLAVSSLFSANENQMILLTEEPAVLSFLETLLSLFLFTVPFIVCYKIARYRISDLVSFKKTEKGIALPLFLLGISFCSFANIGASYVDYFFKSIGVDYSVETPEMPEGFFGFVLSIIATALVPALVEEFALRGLVLGSLRKFGDGFALIASSVCFGIMHGNFEQIPFAVLVGLFLGFTVIKTNSLRVAMGIHFANNLVAVLMAYFPKSVSSEIQNVIYLIYLLLALVLGIIVLKSIDTDLLRLDSTEAALSTKQKYKAFFLSGGIIAFIIVYLLEAVSLIFI